VYTIKQAAARTGLSVAVIRVWERRYGVVEPGRTAAGYRLYDDGAIDRVRRMRGLVDAGWAPSQAARAILDGTSPDEMLGTGAAPSAGSVALPGPTPTGDVAWLNLRLLGAARALDDAGIESALGEGLALLGVDAAIEGFILPALVEIGAAWARGELTVAAEHAASNSVMRRLAGLYEAAATPSSAVDCVIGLPPGSRHEIGALAFAVACRRAGLRVLYLGADVPVASWIAVAREHQGAAVALGAVTRDEADSAAKVAAALRSERQDLLIAIGGAGQARAAEATSGILLLPPGLRDGAALLARRIVAGAAAAG